MKFIIDTEENVAKKAAQRYVELLKAKPDAVLGFATGSTRDSGGRRRRCCRDCTAPRCRSCGGRDNRRRAPA